MLPEKLASMVSARGELAAAAVSTPRIIARVQGKALNYGCAIPFVAVAAPSLSQLMHNRETGTVPVAAPSLDDEKEAEFDWDRELRVSKRARRALEFMRTAMDKYGNVGQPLWTVVPSSLYGAFLAGEERDASILVITFDASVHSWAVVLCTAPNEPGASGPQWACSALPSLVLLLFHTVRRRRCIGRRSRVGWRPRPRVSCSRSQTTQF
jgi:hypothetical protein